MFTNQPAQGGLFANQNQNQPLANNTIFNMNQNRGPMQGFQPQPGFIQNNQMGQFMPNQMPNAFQNQQNIVQQDQQEISNILIAQFNVFQQIDQQYHKLQEKVKCNQAIYEHLYTQLKKFNEQMGQNEQNENNSRKLLQQKLKNKKEQNQNLTIEIFQCQQLVEQLAWKTNQVQKQNNDDMFLHNKMGEMKEALQDTFNRINDMRLLIREQSMQKDPNTSTNDEEMQQALTYAQDVLTQNQLDFQKFSKINFGIN